MRVVITGGGGFLGRQLTRALVSRGSLSSSPINRIVVFDVMPPPEDDMGSVLAAADRVGIPVDVIVDPSGCLESHANDLVSSSSSSPLSVFHLASIMSGPCEGDHLTAWSNNVGGTRALLEACRDTDTDSQPTFVFSSSVASMPPAYNVSDDTKLVPHNTYGMTKAVCEMLVNDYSRKGFVSGVSARLPTVIVRPGAPNAATTSAFSGVVREPLNGDTAVVPFDPDYRHAVSSHRNVVAALITLAEVDKAPLGVDRAVNLPALECSINDLYTAAGRLAEKAGLPLGDMKVEIDDDINAIVTSFCSSMDSSRAQALGAPVDPSIDAIIGAYGEDFLGLDMEATGLASTDTPKPKPSVGFVGLGFMGLGMARNIAAAGFPLSVYNRTSAKAEALAAEFPGLVSVVDSPKDVAAASSVVLTCLQNEAAVDDVYFGEDGLFAGVSANPYPSSVVLADHSTVSVATSRRCAEAAQSLSAAFLDAPVSGGPEGAAAGTLAVMVGGDSDAFDAALPVLDAVGDAPARMGETGAGTVAKLVNQALVGTHALAACEALSLASALTGSKDFTPLLALLDKSWGNSKILQRCGAVVTEAAAAGGSNDAFAGSGAPLRNLAKDLGIIVEAAESVHPPVTMPSTLTAARLYSALTERGMGGHDMAVAFNAIGTDPGKKE